MEPWLAKIIQNLKYIILVAWVDKALNQSLTKKIYIKFGFRFCGIHPLDPKAMECRIGLSYIYTTLATSEGEEDYNSNDEVEKNQH